MEKVKEPSIAGTFYSNDTVDLIKELETIKHESKNFYKTPSRAVIVPHAGFVFSGTLAYEGINILDRRIKNIFIIAPSHHVAFEGLGLSGFEKWKTPLGDIEVNQEINNELIEKFGAAINNDAIVLYYDLLSSIPANIGVGKKASAFGDYGWSGEAVPNLLSRLKQLRFNVFDGVRINFELDEKGEAEIKEFVDRVLA